MLWQQQQEQRVVNRDAKHLAAELRLARQFSPNQISVELRAPICSSIHTKPDRCELETHVYMFVSTDWTLYKYRYIWVCLKNACVNLFWGIAKRLDRLQQFLLFTWSGGGAVKGTLGRVLWGGSSQMKYKLRARHQTCDLWQQFESYLEAQSSKKVWAQFLLPDVF